MNKLGLAAVSWVLAIFCLWIPASEVDGNIVRCTSIKCHVCNSLHNESCDYIEDNRYLTECQKVNDNQAKNHTICRKEVFSVSSTEFAISSYRTVRTCGYEKHPKFNCFYNSNHDLKETICECIEDGCNEGSALRFTLQCLVYSLLTSYLVSRIIT